jgi:hypothetical protein
MDSPTDERMEHLVCAGGMEWKPTSVSPGRGPACTGSVDLTCMEAWFDVSN